MKKNLLILLSCIAILGCDKNDDLLDKIDSYPIAVGNEWTYKIEIILKEYDSESFDMIINIDTIVAVSNVKVTKDTILNDLVEVKQVRTIVNNTINYRYVNLDKEGLKEYGYFNQGFNSIYIHEIPRLEVKLPLYKNSVWNYSSNHWGVIEKKVIDSEVLKIDDNDILCFKIQIFNDAYSIGKIFEWISKEGLIKRQEIEDKRILQLGDGSQKYIQLTTTTKLTDLKLE